MKTKAIAAEISAKASPARAGRRLFRNHVLKGSPGNDRKERVEEREGRNGDDFGESEEDQDRDRLAEPDRASVARRQDETVDHSLLALRGEGACKPEERREDDRDPEQPRRGEVGRVPREDEVKDHERR